MFAPHSSHYVVDLHILRYIKGTLFHGLHFFLASSPILCVYSNTNWARNPMDHHSLTGYYILSHNSLIS